MSGQKHQMEYCMNETFDAMEREVGRLMSTTPEADPKVYAFAYVCSEIDRLKKQMAHLIPERDIMD